MVDIDIVLTIAQNEDEANLGVFVVEILICTIREDTDVDAVIIERIKR